MELAADVNPPQPRAAVFVSIKDHAPPPHTTVSVNGKLIKIKIKDVKPAAGERAGSITLVPVDLTMFGERVEIAVLYDAGVHVPEKPVIHASLLEIPLSRPYDDADRPYKKFAAAAAKPPRPLPSAGEPNAQKKRRMYVHALFHELATEKEAWNLAVLVRMALIFQNREPVCPRLKKSVNKGAMSVEQLGLVLQFAKDAAVEAGVAFPDDCVVGSYGLTKQFSMFEDVASFRRHLYPHGPCSAGLCRAVFNKAVVAIPAVKPLEDEHGFIAEALKRKEKVLHSMLPSRCLPPNPAAEPVLESGVCFQ